MVKGAITISDDAPITPQIVGLNWHRPVGASASKGPLDFRSGGPWDNPTGNSKHFWTRSTLLPILFMGKYQAQEFSISDQGIIADTLATRHNLEFANACVSTTFRVSSPEPAGWIGRLVRVHCPYWNRDWAAHWWFSRRSCDRKPARDSSVVCTSGSGGNLDWSGEFCREPRWDHGSTGGRFLASHGSYVPGFELASIVLFAGVLAYWFVVGELKPRDS